MGQTVGSARDLAHTIRTQSVHAFAPGKLLFPETPESVAQHQAFALAILWLSLGALGNTRVFFPPGDTKKPYTQRIRTPNPAIRKVFLKREEGCTGFSRFN